MMVGTVQNDSITLQQVDGKLVAKILLVCAAVFLLFLGLASKADAKPALAFEVSTLVTPGLQTQASSEATVSATSKVAAMAGPTNVQITYDDASCSICHSNNVQLEHQKYAGCTLCHPSGGAATSVSTDYTKGAPAMDSTGTPSVDIAGSATKKGCGVDVDACHGPGGDQAWHGSGVAGAWAVDAMNSAHAVTMPAASSPMASGISCGGYTDGTGAATCHSTGSTQSPFYFGALDLAAAHADYSNAVKNNLTGPGTSPSPVITASASACGICHEKDSPMADMLRPEIYYKWSDAGGSLTCTTCHDDSSTYVTLDQYPTDLKTAYPDLVESLCFKAEPGLVDGLLTTSASAPLSLSSLASLPTTSSAEATSTVTSASTQVDDLLSQLSPELQAQLSGVMGQQQKQLSAGTLPTNNAGIPASALPATSISKIILFR